MGCSVPPTSGGALTGQALRDAFKIAQARQHADANDHLCMVEDCNGISVSSCRRVMLDEQRHQYRVPADSSYLQKEVTIGRFELNNVLIRQTCEGLTLRHLCRKSPMHFTQPRLLALHGSHGELKIIRHLGAIIRTDLEALLSEPMPDEFLALLYTIEAAAADQNPQKHVSLPDHVQNESHSHAGVRQLPRPLRRLPPLGGNRDYEGSTD